MNSKQTESTITVIFRHDLNGLNFNMLVSEVSLGLNLSFQYIQVQKATSYSIFLTLFTNSAISENAANKLKL